MNFLGSFQLHCFLLLVLATKLHPTTCNLLNINLTFPAIASNGDDGIRVVPTIPGGARQNEYTWGLMEDPLDGEVAWLKAKQNANRDRAYYATLTQEIPAETYWNTRIMFQGLVGWKGLSQKNKGFSSLVARVVSGYGQTLAMDNMQGRPLVGWVYQRQLVSVVLDVPGPPSTTSCPAVGTLPAFIHLGIMLSGGVGYIDIRQATLSVVGTDVPITGRPSSL